VVHVLAVGQNILLMPQKETEEADWKYYRSIVTELRERYLRDRNEDLVAILTRESSTQTENFWAAKERMDEFARILSACLDDHRRSRMFSNMFLMYQHKMITDDDLKGFSEDIRQRIFALI